MARVPVITSPCPLRFASMPRAGRDHCGHCDRQVHNLDGMTTAQRESFLGGCVGKTCVAYTVQRRVQRRSAALGAGLLAAMAVPGAMAAPNDADPAPVAVSQADLQAATPLEQDDENMVIEELIVTGGTIEDGQTVRWTDEDDVDTGAVASLQTIGDADWLPSRNP